MAKTPRVFGGGLSAIKARDSLRESFIPSQLIVFVVSIALVLIGVAGFAVTGVDHFATPKNAQSLLGATLNPLQNVIHIGTGIAGLAIWRRRHVAQTYAMVVFALCGALFVYGLFAAGSTTSANFLALDNGSNALHAVVAVAALLGAMLPGERRTRSIAQR